MSKTAEWMCCCGTVAVAAGLWLERPSLALMFCGAMLMFVGVHLIRKRGVA